MCTNLHMGTVERRGKWITTDNDVIKYCEKITSQKVKAIYYDNKYINIHRNND